MIRWQNQFQQDIFFVSPDMKRALGLEDVLSHYHIICSVFDPLIPILRKKGAHIFCLQEKIGDAAFKINNSGALLEYTLVEDYIKQESHATPCIMYFKPSLKLDLLIEKKGYKPVGNKASFNEQFENKLLVHKLFMESLPRFTINSVIGILGKLDFADLVKKLGLPFVVQFGHGWAGKTTFFIDKEETFRNLVKQFVHTKVKVSKKINGFTVLNNCCIYQGSVLVSPPAIQISDIPLLFSKPGVTCGRQWPAKFLDKKQIDKIDSISRSIGKLMGKAGFNGFFGLDFLVEAETNRLYVSEINARLTASTSFYTYLERGLGWIPLLIYHLAAFLNESIPEINEKIPNITGSQITLRQPAKNFDNLADFGVYAIKDGQPILVGDNYSPDKLNQSEFIYIRRKSLKKQKEGEELARIETRKEVLKTPKQLQSWLNDLLSLMTPSRADQINDH